MSPDDPLAEWATSRRSVSLPEDFCQRVMEVIDADPAGPGGARPARGQRVERTVGLLLAVCSCVVVVVRLSSLIGLVVPSADDQIITQEFSEESEEVSRVAPDVT